MRATKSVQLLDHNGRPINSALQRRALAVRRPALKARYDAAQTTADNRRHWLNADSLSADAAASPEVRRILRMRARYEVANNSYAKGIVQTLANYVIGTGPRLQMISGDPKVDRTIETEFAHWARAVNLAAKLRTMRMARTTNGEAFAVVADNPRLGTPVQCDLQLREADQVTAPNMPIFKDNAVDGITFDRYGNPVVYHVLKRHPGDMRSGAVPGFDYERIPARHVIHYFKPDRPGQHRGIPEITPALPLFAQLRRYTLAVIAAAETAADFAAVLYSEIPAQGEPASDVEPMDEIELQQRMATVLPEGWKLGQIKSEQPATTYIEFKDAILNEIARCLDIPFNVAALNSSSYNYASGRLDHQAFFKSIFIDQQFTEATVLDRILAAWLDEAVLIENYLPQAARMRNARLPHQWFWDGYEHVDPAKEAVAQEKRLKNNTTTLAIEFARQGRDWEVELRQRAKEKQLMRELGLTQEEAKPAGKEAAEDAKHN